MYSKKQIINLFNLSNTQVLKIDKFIAEIKQHNNHTNIVGKSTLIEPWKRHVLDSLQISNFIQNKKSSICDMGTGAGIPGLILSIKNYTNISLIDSNAKKINFIRSVIPKLDIRAKIYLKRIEAIQNKKFDFLVSRALANLNKLFFYSQYFLKQDTVLIFLKGKTYKNEIIEAYKKWEFYYEIHKSLSDKLGTVLIINHLKKIND